LRWAAYHVAKAGHSVEVIEAAPERGRMAAHFNFERFYHFACKTDMLIFALLDELGLGNACDGVRPSMGYFIDGKLHDWAIRCYFSNFRALAFLRACVTVVRFRFRPARALGRA